MRSRDEARLGPDVTLATNGLVVLTLLTANHFDLILMDCHMPGMDGFETTVAIRRDEAERAKIDATQPRRIPIIAITANAMKGDRERCLGSGMDDYIAKPCSIDVLPGVISRWALKAGRVREAA